MVDGDQNAQNQNNTPAPDAKTPAPDGKGTWYGDAKYEGVVGAKGWKSPAEVIESYTNLERISRTPANRTVVLPEKDDDAAGWGQVYDRLGRPAKPDEYKLEGFTPVEGQQDIVQGENGFLKAAHEAGITQRQANAIYKWYAGRFEADNGQAAEVAAERATAELDALRNDWGNAFNSNVALAKHAASTLGVSQEQLEAIENTLGTKWLMETFHKIGAGMAREPGRGPSQDPIDGDDAGARDGFGISPAVAQAKIEELMNDQAFYRKYMEGDKASFERIAKLTEAAAGRAPAGRGRVQLR